jgi:hypothetical protein
MVPLAKDVEAAIESAVSALFIASVKLMSSGRRMNTLVYGYPKQTPKQTRHSCSQPIQVRLLITAAPIAPYRSESASSTRPYKKSS